MNGVKKIILATTAMFGMVGCSNNVSKIVQELTPAQKAMQKEISVAIDSLKARNMRTADCFEAAFDSINSSNSSEPLKRAALRKINFERNQANKCNDKAFINEYRAIKEKYKN